MSEPGGIQDDANGLSFDQAEEQKASESNIQLM